MDLAFCILPIVEKNQLEKKRSSERACHTIHGSLYELGERKPDILQQTPKLEMPRGPTENLRLILVSLPHVYKRESNRLVVERADRSRGTAKRHPVSKGSLTLLWTLKPSPDNRLPAAHGVPGE